MHIFLLYDHVVEPYTTFDGVEIYQLDLWDLTTIWVRPTYIQAAVDYKKSLENDTDYIF